MIVRGLMPQLQDKWYIDSELSINLVYTKNALYLICPMKFICIYCHRIMNQTNFTDFIKDSDNKDAEYHAWRHLTFNEEETEAKSEMLLQLC
jgi:hypothetical protein